MAGDNGNQFLMLDKSFNLLATMHDPEKSHVCLKLEFEQSYTSQNKPLNTQNGTNPQNKPVKRQQITKKALDNAKLLLQTDVMHKQSLKAGHILPFDDEIEF